MSTPRQLRPRAKTLIDPFELKGGLPAAYVPHGPPVAAPDATPVDTKLEELAARDAERAAAIEEAATSASAASAPRVVNGANGVAGAPAPAIAVRDRASTSSEVDAGWGSAANAAAPAVDPGAPAAIAVATATASGEVLAAVAAAPSGPGVSGESAAAGEPEPGDDRLSLPRRWPLTALAPRARGWCSEE